MYSYDQYDQAMVDTRVEEFRDQVKRRLGHFRSAIGDEGVKQLPMGTFCTMPFRCPHLARCGKALPAASGVIVIQTGRACLARARKGQSLLPGNEGVG